MTPWHLDLVGWTILFFDGLMNTGALQLRIFKIAALLMVLPGWFFMRPLRLPQAAFLKYTYDELNRVITIRGNVQPPADIRYDQDGRRVVTTPK